jgi:hypothetical protein
MHGYEKLIGKTIVTVGVDDARELLTFGLQGGEVVQFRTYGDCCSHTWIEHLEVPAGAVPGSTILGVENVGMGSKEVLDSEGYADSFLQFYETRFKTIHGDIVVEYRNSSNGYYGGSLDLVE